MLVMRWPFFVITQKLLKESFWSKKFHDIIPREKLWFFFLQVFFQTLFSEIKLFSLREFHVYRTVQFHHGLRKLLPGGGFGLQATKRHLQYFSWQNLKDC